MVDVIHPARSVAVTVGPLVLAGARDGTDLAAHRDRVGALPAIRLRQLLALTRDAAVRGRGGAGFPMARKLQTVDRSRGRIGTRRPVIVINAAEGEPASAKDTALLQVAPHLVLDGAVLAARALRTREVHIVTSADRPWGAAAVTTALTQRDDGVSWRHQVTTGGFVSGQARAVVELLSGRANLPVTSRVPEAVRGIRGRPTLVSNAESLAHLAALVRTGADAYASLGAPGEPGTTLLTLTGPPGDDGRFRDVRVVEVAHGSPASSLLDDDALEAPVLLGGFHGTWLGPEQVRRLTWSGTASHPGVALGAGVVLTLRGGGCPVHETARYVAYLAAQSARRCGPCRFGLPALAREVSALDGGADTRGPIRELVGLVDGRGACAHPDGTARLVHSLLTHLEAEVDTHLHGGCSCDSSMRVAAP
ncbi:MAG: NADH-ubiquinone oxidoreductase-F iron-sulfur binding region domain-containing protein [Dermatophilaceae bacterium]